MQLVGLSDQIRNLRSLTVNRGTMLHVICKCIFLTLIFASFFPFFLISKVTVRKPADGDCQALIVCPFYPLISYLADAWSRFVHV